MAPLEIYCTSARNAKECRSHIAGLSRNLAARDPLLASVSPPHSFSAAGCAVSGSVVAWHSLTPLPFRGLSPGPVRMFDCPGYCRAVVTVSFSDGSSVSSGWRSPDTRPAEILPLLYYPDPDACRITIRADTDAGEYVFEARSPRATTGRSTYAPDSGLSIPLPSPAHFPPPRRSRHPPCCHVPLPSHPSATPSPPTSAAIVSPSAIQALVLLRVHLRHGNSHRLNSWHSHPPAHTPWQPTPHHPSRPAVKGSRLLDPRAVATPRLRMHRT